MVCKTVLVCLALAAILFVANARSVKEDSYIDKELSE